MGRQVGRAEVGVLYGVAAYGAWGLLPLYFHALHDVGAPQILAHRALSSTVFLGALLTLRGEWGTVAAARAWPGRFALSTLTLGMNWLLYIWAVATGHTLEASLGYFINPLVNVLFGRLFLGERLRPWQWASVAIAAAGVGSLVVATGTVPWIPLVLAGSFGSYGLVRKRLPVAPLAALFVETAAMAPFAAAWLAWQAHAGVAWYGTEHDVPLLLAAGVVTATPLLWFGAAAQRVQLSTLGILQYLAPTGQFLLAITVFGEPWSAAQAVTFALIWVGCAVYTVDALRAWRAPIAD